jgi:DNA-binding CsgD family transcriptional regulator
VVLDLVEAAVRSGRIDQARAHVAAAQQAGLHRIGPRIALMITGAAALTADDDEAGSLFEAALSVLTPPGGHGRTRVQFAYGQWLRRTHDTTFARVHLRLALETFDRIGAEGFAQRTREELRAAGVAYAVQPDIPTSPLTAQERQIADLADRLTNKQIAERLFLSHRTVGSHPHRLYPKLGVASRTALRAALDAIACGEDAAQSAHSVEGLRGGWAAIEAASSANSNLATRRSITFARTAHRFPRRSARSCGPS